MGPGSPRSHSRDHRLLASPRPHPDPIRRNGQTRLPLRDELVVVDGSKVDYAYLADVGQRQGRELIGRRGEWCLAIVMWRWVFGVWGRGVIGRVRVGVGGVWGVGLARRARWGLALASAAAAASGFVGGERHGLVMADSGHIDFERVLGVLRRRWWVVVLLCVVCGGAAFGFSRLQHKQYTATASVLFSDQALQQQAAGLPVLQSSSSQDPQIMATNIQLLTSQSGVSAATARVVGHGLTASGVAQCD